ncbi:MAG: hypothetical protein WBN94_00880, partial [Methanothrix sp.]
SHLPPPSRILAGPAAPGQAQDLATFLAEYSSRYNPDLLFGQPIKLVDQGVYLIVCGHYLASNAAFRVWVASHSRAKPVRGAIP